MSETISRQSILTALARLDATEDLAKSVSEIRTFEDFNYAIRNFLDRFAQNPSSHLIYEEPPLLVSVLDDDGLADAYVASVAAWLAQKHHIFCPAWTDKDDRVKKKPWFAAKTPNLKAILLQESPAAFRVRNLFVSANALSRA